MRDDHDPTSPADLFELVVDTANADSSHLRVRIGLSGRVGSAMVSYRSNGPPGPAPGS